MDINMIGAYNPLPLSPSPSQIFLPGDSIIVLRKQSRFQRLVMSLRIYSVYSHVKPYFILVLNVLNLMEFSVSLRMAIKIV